MKQKPSKELQAEWNQKLQDSGFEDIETADGRLKMWSARWNTPKYRKTLQARQEYTYLANQLLNNYPFDSELDRVIWGYHVDAIGVRDIADILNKLGIYNKTNRNSVHNVIKRYRAIMFRLYLKG